MNEEGKFWIRLWAMAFTAICVLAMTLCFYYAYTTHQYVENGFTQKTIPGEAFAVWVKCDQGKEQ